MVKTLRTMFCVLAVLMTLGTASAETGVRGRRLGEKVKPWAVISKDMAPLVKPEQPAAAGQPAPKQRQQQQQPAPAVEPQQPSPTPQPQQPTVNDLSGGNCPDPAAALDYINALRQRRGAAPVTWAPRLAQSAQAWVNNCVFEHSDYGALGVGETMMWGGKPGGCAIAMGAWAAEEPMWVPGTEPTVATFGAGHFTQQVWKSTTEVGCGLNYCGDWALIACHYNPMGNIVGGFTANVG